MYIFYLHFLLYLYTFSNDNVYGLSAAHLNYEELKLFETPVTYSVVSTVLISDVTANDKEVGYKIKATLDVEPIWSKIDAESDTQLLLKFEVQDAHVWMRGTKPNAEFKQHSSDWDSFNFTPFYAHWHNGVILNTYIHPDDHIDLVNYKKSLVSVFQLQATDGEYTETDASGECDVAYEAPTTRVVRKVKAACRWAGGADGLAASARVSRYSLAGAAGALRLEAALAEELHRLTAAEGAAGAPGLAARVRLELRAGAARAPAAGAGAGAGAAGGVREALRPRGPLRAHALPLADAAAGAEQEDGGDRTSLREAVEALAALRGAEGEAAPGAEELAAALRRAAPALLAGLHGDVTELAAALGAWGGAAGLAAARAALRPGPAPHAAPMLVYLASLATATDVTEATAAELLRLREEARRAGADDVADAALLAAAAVAARAGAEASAAVRQTTTRGLERCKDAECRALHLRALGNLRRADAVEALLEHAERDEPAPALAALDAVDALPAAALAPAHLARLARLALAPRPLEVRAAALQTAARAAVAARRALAERFGLPVSLPADLLLAAPELVRRGPRELARLLLQTLADVAPDDLRALARDPRLADWNVLSRVGMSSVLRRELRGPAAGGLAAWPNASLWSSQLASRAVLRRGLVSLYAHAHGEPLHLLTLELWTRGLESLAGGDGGAAADADEDGEEEEAEVEASAGLALRVLDARLPGVRLFRGRGELLGHVWAGTASEPVEVLAHAAGSRAAAALPTAAGAWLRLGARASLASRLSARAQVSLWNRLAKTEVRLRSGVAWAAWAAAGGAWGGARADTRAAAAPELSIAADLDFYERVSLCVKVERASYDHEVATNATQGARGRGRGRGRGVRRARATRARQPPATLALGRDNDRACAAMHAP